MSVLHCADDDSGGMAYPLLTGLTMRPILSAMLILSLLPGLVSCEKKDASSDAEMLTKVTLVTDWYPQPEHGGFYNALVRGYYQEAGLDVTILPGGPNAIGGQRIATGAVEFGLSTSDDVNIQVEQGLPLVAIGPTMQHDPIGIMVREESGIERFEQLEGRSIAVAPAAAWFLFLNKKYNWKNVRVAPLTFSVANFVNDVNYIQQVFITSEPFFVERAKVKYRVLLTRNVGFDPYRVFFTNKNLIEKNPKMVQAFVTASLRGWKDYMVDPSAANAEIAKQNPAMDADKMAYSWNALKAGNYVTGEKEGEFGKLDPARLQKQYEILKSIGLLKKDLGVEAAYTTQFLEGNVP